MKTGRILAFIAIGALIITSVEAQTYSFTESTGTYTDLTGTTSINGSTVWDNEEFTIPIGFSFRYFDMDYDSIVVSDGWTYFDIGVYNYLMDVMLTDWKDTGSTTPKSPISYKLTGVPGSQILMIEWKDAGFVSDPSGLDYMNCQLWLYEGLQKFEIHIGPSSVSSSYQHGCGQIHDPGVETYYLSGDSANVTYNTGFGSINGTPASGTIYTFSHACTPDMAISPTATSICAGSSLTLDAGAGFSSYLWSPGMETSQTISVNSTGIYGVMVDSAGCSSVDTVTITVSGTPATAAAGDDSTICAGNAYTLSGSIGGGASTSLWTTSGSGTFDDNTLANATYTASLNDTAAGCVTLTITTDAPGVCPAASDDMVLCFNQCMPPVPSFTGSSTSPCESDCINFTDASTNAPTSWTWTFTGGTPGTSTDKNPMNICYSTAGSYDVKLVATNGGGSDSITMSNYIVVGATATAMAGADDAICAGSTYTLAGTIGGSASSSTWSSSGTGTFSDVNSLTAVYTPSGADTVAGSVTVTVTTDDPTGACVAAVDDMILTINARPMAGFTFAPTMLSVVFTNSTTGAATYSWDFGDGSALDTSTDPTHTYTADNTYTVCLTATSSAGCMNQTCMSVTVTGTGIGEYGSGMDISVYPNPSNGEFTLAFEQLAKSNTSIKVYSITGQVVHTESLDNFSGSYKGVFDLSGVGNGIYYLEIKTESIIARYKIAVQ